METWDAIMARRNTRQLAARAVPPDDLDRILEAGRRSPSSRNWQPWDFVVVTDPTRRAELAKVWPFAGHVASAPAAIAVVAPVPSTDRQRDLLHYDLGQATMSMMLGAADLGIGTAHAAVGDQVLARSLLGLPEDRFLAYLISVGYPADRPLRPVRHPDRRPFDEVVHRDRW
ncbi:MAG: nitroreductase family protein [Acidimicrobiales bacterium]